jgi:hypothetical protein
MRFPRWILIPLVSAIVAIAADRLRVEYRLASVEEAYKMINDRLGRIETKLDQVIEERHVN